MSGKHCQCNLHFLMLYMLFLLETCCYFPACTLRVPPARPRMRMLERLKRLSWNFVMSFRSVLVEYYVPLSYPPVHCGVVTINCCKQSIERTIKVRCDVWRSIGKMRTRGDMVLCWVLLLYSTWKFKMCFVCLAFCILRNYEVAVCICSWTSTVLKLIFDLPNDLIVFV